MDDANVSEYTPPFEEHNRTDLAHWVRWEMQLRDDCARYSKGKKRGGILNGVPLLQSIESIEMLKTLETVGFQHSNTSNTQQFTPSRSHDRYY